MEARRQWDNIKVVKDYSQPRILYPAKLSFKDEGKINTVPDKLKLRESVASRPAL